LLGLGKVLLVVAHKGLFHIGSGQGGPNTTQHGSARTSGLRLAIAGEQHAVHVEADSGLLAVAGETVRVGAACGTKAGLDRVLSRGATLQPNGRRIRLRAFASSAEPIR